MLFTDALPGKLNVAGSEIEYLRTGAGRSLLYLHGFDGVSPDDPFIAPLAARFDVIAPSLPGFGASTRSSAVRTIDDLAHFGLALARSLNLQDALLVGSSFGGWLAAELAAKGSPHFSGLVLADPVGARFSKDPTEKEIRDIFRIEAKNYPAYLFAETATLDRVFRGGDFSLFSEDEVVRFCKNREGLTQFGWSPLLYSPGLPARLGLIDIPTLVLWGHQDRIVAPDYGRQFAAAIPQATFRVVEGAGHYLPIEKPDEFGRSIVEFSKVAEAA